MTTAAGLTGSGLDEGVEGSVDEGGDDATVDAPDLLFRMMPATRDPAEIATINPTSNPRRNPRLGRSGGEAGNATGAFSANALGPSRPRASVDSDERLRPPVQVAHPAHVSNVDDLSPGLEPAILRKAHTEAPSTLALAHPPPFPIPREHVGERFREDRILRFLEGQRNRSLDRSLCDERYAALSRYGERHFHRLESEPSTGRILP